jgi:tetratricopeptide (TPR) repeat protein
MGAIPAVVALGAAGACAAAVTRLRGSERAAALALVAGTAAFALHNEIDWEWRQTALTLLAYPIPVLVACAAGGAAVRRPLMLRFPRFSRVPRIGRRSAAVAAAVVLALAAIPAVLPVLSDNALARATALDDQGRLDEARVEADLAAALNPTSVDVQLERASLLQSLKRPADARRAVEHAISLAPDDAEVWLQLAGYEKWCWGDKTAWKADLAHARSLAGHDNVFAGSDADVMAGSDACA